MSDRQYAETGFDWILRLATRLTVWDPAASRLYEPSSPTAILDSVELEAFERARGVSRWNPIESAAVLGRGIRLKRETVELQAAGVDTRTSLRSWARWVEVRRSLCDELGS